MEQNKTVINDPVFGFISIPNDFTKNLIDHPYLQRLKRIKQLGLASFAFPGAQHTRFHHTLGAMHLMWLAINSLRAKGNEITDHEANGTLAAILLHDVGHGPFSHVLEYTLTNGISHEAISSKLMDKLNSETHGQLDLCIAIFKNEYPKKFLHQLVSGQLDADRLDYLRRDCFFTGVSEGDIGSERIIKILDVRNNNLVVESKGIYSVENFLLSRRLMYWQVYHHKTALSAESILINALHRAKELITQGKNLFASPSLSYFLSNNVCPETFGEEALQHFINLDDSDIISALKVWTTSKDKVLSTLSRCFINRQLFKIEILPQKVSTKRIEKFIKEYALQHKIPEHEARYFIASGTISNNLYDKADNSIDILDKSGNIKNISEVSDLLNIQLLSKKAEKYYFAYMPI